MLAGPVCHFELVRIARSGRTFALRSVFGLVLLGTVGISYLGQAGPSRPWFDPGVLTIEQMSHLGLSVFLMIIAALTALVLGLTPALVADAIASERQRKTLDDVLASRLTSVEIVVGKLAARLINVGVFPVLVLPILSLLTLLGGVVPLAVVLSYSALFASTYFLASLSLLVSVLARRPRDAMGIAYTLTAAWLFVPLLFALLGEALPSPWADVVRGIEGAGRWVGPPSPLGLVTNAAAVLGGGTDRLQSEIGWMVSMEAAYGTVFVALAAWQLRPAFRRQEGRAGRQGRAARFARRTFPIRPCTDNPVFWKEAYFTPNAGGVGKRLTRLAIFILLGAALVGASIGSVGAFRELVAHGYGFGDHPSYANRLVFNLGLRYGTGLLFVIWMLWLGGVTAAGLSSEREEETWISLLATPLEAEDVLRGKMLGPLRATAHFGVIIVTLWLIGLIAGAVHPVGFVNASIVLVLYTWFMIALGTYKSLHAKATWLARVWTQGILVAPHVCCLFPLPSAGVLLGLSLWSYSEIDALLAEIWQGDGRFMAVAAIWFAGGIVSYGGAAYFLTRATFRGFDTVAGRPRRPRDTSVVLKPWTPAEKQAAGEDELA